MPGKNLEKHYLQDSYYHIYNRGVSKRTIFLDDDDYRVFLNLLKRYMGDEVQLDSKKREYPNYHNEAELIAYCLMPNHFHLLLFVKEHPDMMKNLMMSTMTAYSVYFNKRHNRVGSLFGKQYRAVLITSEPQLWHITRYIHLNPEDKKDSKYREYEYSSIGYYIGSKHSSWVNAERILEMFDEAGQDYTDFLDEYIDKRIELKQIEEDLF